MLNQIRSSSVCMTVLMTTTDHFYRACSFAIIPLARPTNKVPRSVALTSDAAVIVHEFDIYTLSQVATTIVESILSSSPSRACRIASVSRLCAVPLASHTCLTRSSQHGTRYR